VGRSLASPGHLTMPIGTDDVVAVLGGMGGMAGLLKLASWRREGRVANADASQRITAAAATLVEQTGSLLPGLTGAVAEMRGELNAQAEELARVRADRDVERAELARIHAWLVDHQSWDLAALQLVRQLGGDLAPPAPPPTRHPAVV
jgi:hypothetical protein